MQLVEVAFELADGAGFGGSCHVRPDCAQLHTRHALHDKQNFIVTIVVRFGEVGGYDAR